MKPNGEIVALGAYEGDGHPPSQNVIDLMTQAFGQHAKMGQLRAAAICYNVRTIPPGQTEKSDAVCASLEHQSGEALNVFVPYQKATDGGIRYMQLFATARTPQFFVLHETS